MKNSILISPSMMCADFFNLENEMKNLEAAEIDIYHMDIMDGSYVPNHALALHDVKTVKQNTNKLVDVHLMVENPEEIIDLYIEAQVDIVYFHVETVKFPVRFINKLKAKGIKVGAALNPHQSVDLIKDILPLLDYVLIMSVDPGFAGQKFVDLVDKKIEFLVDNQSNYNYQIAIDGAISEEKITKYSKLGISIFVVGTSTLFGKEEDYKTIINRVKQ